MLYLTCTMISSVDLALYGVSRVKDWVSVDCGTTIIKRCCGPFSLFRRLNNLIKYKCQKLIINQKIDYYMLNEKSVIKNFKKKKK